MKLRRWTTQHSLGLLLGIVTPIIIAPLVLLIIALFQDYYYSQLWHKFTLNRPYQIKIITLSIIANLLWFYIFLNKGKYNISKGIIIATLLFTPYVIYIKFF